MARWSDREPDEDEQDWMLRVQIGLAAIDAHRARTERKAAS